MPDKLKHYEIAEYQIRFQGAIDESWIEYLDLDLTVQLNQEDPQSITTTLTGKIRDQAALLGLLNHIYNLGLPILSVEYIS